MQNKEIKKSRNEQIAELLASGERIKDFYRFTAQNPHIDLHDACQIVLARPKASICFYMDEWNEMGRRVTKNRRGIQFYDADGSKQIVFDLHDTHGDKRYRRLIFPMRRLLYGLDELNGTEIAESNRRDYSKVLSGVAQYLDDNGYFTADEQRNNLIAEGVAYSLYSKTGFPKDNNISLRGMPYDLDENARLFKEVYLLTEFAKEDISAAYERRINTPRVIDDIEEETVSDEPPLAENPAQEETSDSAAPTGTEEEIPEPEEEEPESQEETAPAANPLYERYMAAQHEKPNAAVLIRVGDFYEVFGERAEEVAEWLDITLTSRDVGLPERIPMCGFPCYAADLYIQKLLEHCGAYILEPDAEPIYIRPHEAPRAGEAEQPIEEHDPKTESETEFTFEAAELDELNELLSEELSTSAETPTAAEQPEISGVGEPSGKEQTISEPSEPEEEEYTEDEEPEEDEEEYESDEEEDRETQADEKKDSKVKGKEKSIRERKRKDKPQLSLFDLLDGEKEPSREEQLIERQLLRGSGIEDGKYRIYEKYFTDPTVKEYAKFLKDEYGIGGYGYGQERQDHNGKGIRMEWTDREHPENNIRIDLKWNEVAVRIADLIDEDKYLNESEKEDYEKRYKSEQAEKQRQRTEEQKKKDDLVSLVIQNTNPIRKQHISDEYTKNTDHTKFAEFLCNEYGYSTEVTSEYLARYDANGVWLSKYDRNGNTELRVYLSWNDFAGKVCDLIEDARYISDDTEERLKQIADSMIETGIEHTGDGNYAYFFGTFGQDERFVKEHYEELSEALRKRTEVKDVYRDDWYIHVTYYKDYCVELQGTDAANREHEDRVRAIAAQIVEEGTENTTEGNWVVYFNELTGDEEFAKTNAQEIAEELGRHEAVADVEFDNDCFNTAFYLDYCPNYIPHEDEDWYAEESEAAEAEQRPIKPFNRFTELSSEDKTYFDEYIQKPYREPSNSPWDTVEECTVIAPGIYSVSTAGHGGIMIDRALAPHILSSEALAEGFVENGCYCYEEDAAESIPLRELYNKGILNKTNEYFTRLEYVSTDPDAEDEYIRFSDLPEMEQERKLQQWNDAVNETVAHWYPKYWEAYQQALQTSLKAKNTDLNAVLDQSELGGAKSRFKGNTDAIRLMNKLYFENREATDAERKVLAKYVGWGGLAQAFDESNEQWSKEYAELKDLLTTEQYEKAKGSVLNAHYTGKEVIDGIYAALQRFGIKNNNRILEPAMGTGNFFGYMPQAISDGAKLYGVELDEVTGKIAAKLYPQAKVQIKGFEETSFPQDYFDIVVGNVPFGGYGVYDSEYSRQKFMIHDYFIAKSIDRVKPNGIVAVVTSKGTLDKLNPVARKYMAERAELLGALRLPNNAFKQTANTEAVTDILFFQKREERINDTSDIEWLGTGKTEDGFEVNNYFIAHPEMVLGTFAKETGLYGAEGLTVKPDGRNLGEAIAAAIETLPQNIYENPEHTPAETEQSIDESVFDVRPMCYFAVNGKVYMRVGEALVKQELSSTPKDAYERIAGMIDLRNELRHVLDIQSEGCTDEVLNRAQRKLNADYDRFVRKYGYINSQTNTRLFREDGDAALLFACEVLSEDKTKATKADVFTKRTIRPYSVPAHTSDTLEAMQICRNERGGVDIAYIEELTGKDFDTVLSELGDTVYRDPTMVKEGDKYSGYQTAEEYLSGKVVEKLRIARYFAAEDTAYARNVAALEKVQPEPLKADEISVRIGASWVKPEYYKQFLMELLDIYRFYKDGLQVRYNAFDSSWKVERAEHVRKNAGMNATEKYGTSRANAFRLFEDCLNQRATTIHDTVLEDGREKQVLNQAETIAAREKQNKIKEAFADWIYADPKRREELEETYNSLFNQIRLPSYDGSYLKFPGMNPAIELRPHQKNAVARIAGMGNSTLLHHVVGSGKSFTMAASAMKLRQYGLAKKPMIVVPNHLVQQMANEFRTLYPTAKILVAGKEDLEKNKRKQFVSKVAMGDWDSVIIAQSSFAKIPVSRARQERMMREEIAKIEAAIDEMEEKTGTRVAVKNLERIKKGREAMLKKLLDSGKKDDVLIFENLGVDYLFVDEADAYKNRFLYTKMNNVSGISNAASARASDMQLKIEYINELHGGDKGVVFATGTPISNSMAEMYIMQSYLQKNTLEELGINYFDGWAADFGETVTALEMAPSGQGYRARTRFAKFTNLPELMTLYRSFADVQTADMVKLDVPEAERITVTLEPNEQTVQIAEEIAKRAEAIYGGSVDPHEDNMLKVTSDGKKLALDVRCFDPFLKDEGSGKLDECADNAAKVYEETNALRGTQLIFCDLSTPKKPYESYEYGKDFDVYNDLKHKLIERGIPAEEIAFIHDAKTDKEKQALFDKMNEGRIRILIGSTEKCGAGTNVQKRLAALHHLDAPYRPRDLQQRDGRGIRQGNTNEEVKIFTYVTKRTLDSYCYQILENKQRFISQIENGSLTVREAEDIDETTLSYAEIKAITAANPKIKRKMELETELTRLRVLEGQYRKNLYALQDKTIKDLPTQIHIQEQLLQYAQEDEANMREKYNPDVFSINVLGKVYTDKKEGAAALVEALRSNKYDTPVAEYGGFRISLNPPMSLTDVRSVSLTHHGSYGMEIGDSELGLITRLDNFMRDFPERKGRFSAKLEQLKRDLAVAEIELKKPFEHKGKIEEITKELSEINAELDLNKREEVVIDTEEESDNEEVSYMALPEKEPERTKPASRPHKRMTEKLYALYTDYKAKHPDAVIFLKNGDFYETVGGEAKIAADTYGAATYEKELGGEKRIVAMLTYENLDAMVKDLSEGNRRFKIVEPEKEIGRDTDFLETEEEAKAIAENEKEPEFEAEEEDKAYYSVVPEDEKYRLYMIDNACKIYPVGDLYVTLDEAREAAQTFGDEPQKWERVEVSLDELQEYASNAGDEAKIQVPILPDYYITQEEMHRYGYLWNGVLPLKKPAMRNNFQNCLLLYEDDTEGYIAGESDIEEHDGLFGIERSDWKRFIESENGKAYLAARLFASTVVMKMVGEEYSGTDERELGEHNKFVLRLKAENIALSNYFKDKWFPLPEAMQPYAENIVNEYAERIFDTYKIEARGKSEEDIQSELESRISIPYFAEELSDPQVFKDAAVKETSVRPDYWISGEEMHEYGYTREDMLPLRERAARYLAEQFSLPVYKLYQNNAAEQATNAGDIDAFGGIFGVKREKWERFITTEKVRGYFGASLAAVTAAQKALNNDMGNVDARFTDAVSDELFTQNNEISRYLSHKEQPGTEAMKPYIRQAIQEYAYWLNAKIPFDYGWDEDSIEAAMLNHVEPTELKSYLNQSGGGVRYYGKDTENTAYAYVKGELNEHTFKEILEQSNGADTLVIAAESSAFDAEALRLRSVVYLELGKEIQRADLSNEDAVIGKMQEIVDKLTAERAKQSMDLYQRIRDSVLAEYNEFEKDSEEELPYKQRFYTAVKEYFAKGGANLLDENDMKALEQDKGNILARLYDYDRDGVAHELSDGTEITVLIEYYNKNKVSENAGTEDKDCAAIVRERAERLYEQYKQEHPDYANNRSSNLFYRNMHEYLQETDTLPYAYFIALEKDGENVLSRLCEFYEQNGDLGLHTYGERQEIIEQYTKKYYQEVLHEAEKPKYFGKGADGAAYYFLPGGLSEDTLSDITEKADEYVIAAPKCMLSEEELEKKYITFVKTGRDIPDWAVYGTAATAKHAMREAAEQAKREKGYRSAVANNARQALDNLRDDPTTERAGYKERFFGAFAEFMAESDTFLEAGDYAELIKDGDAITERVYAHYMGMNDKIDFEDWEELSRLTKDYIDERWKMQKAMTEGVPLYGRTLEYAKANDEKNLYRQLLQANIECKHEIEQAIRNNFDGMHLNKGFENKLIEQFGMERIKYVLANTVQENDWDGRYSPETKEWAKTVAVTEKSEHRSQFIIGTHPAVLDGFINRVRKLEKSYKESNEKVFEYGGYHFIPERKFTAEENGFDKISRRLKQDTEMGLCREGYAYESKYPYSHDGFYAASPDKECDLFRCIENGKLYLPCENDLQEYLAELTAEKTTEEKGQTPKEKVHYSYLYEKGPDGAGGYRAYILDESTGTLISVFQNPMDTLEQLSQAMEKEMLGYTSKFNEYVKVEPPELLRMSNQILREKEKGEEVQEEKYRAETKKGLPVVHIEKDKYGHDIAIVKRKDDFVVAIGYDVKDGTWAQGRYDFPTQDAAQKYIDKNYKPQEEEKGKWFTAKVSRDALIRRYDRHSFFRMPNGEYEEYTYNVFNNRVKDSRQLVDLESDGHELCYELVFPADGEVTIKTRDGDEVIFPAEEFTEIINGTANADYEREKHEDDTVWYAISVPQEALRGTYERASLFFMPSKGEYAGYRYFIPNVFVEEDKRGEEGNILITLPESFQVTLRNRDTDDEIVVTPYDLFSLCNGTKGEDYARIPSETEKKAPLRTVIPAAAKIAEYKAQTLFKMPHTGEYDGYCFYLFDDQLSQGDEGIQAKLSENFTVQLKDKKNDRQTTLTAEQFKAIMDAASAEDFDSGLKKPSEEKEDLFKGAEEQLRKNIPEEMLSRPNWVAVKVFRDKKKDKLVKLPKDAKTGEAASPNDPSTWSDFDTACKFAHENGCAALGFALDGKDNICCIDIDHCFNAKREMSDIAKAAWNACGNTYREVSVSWEGLHIFGKTKGMGLQVFSDAGDMEFYERGKFMTVTGDAFGEGRKNLLNLDELPVKDLLSRKFSKHKTYSWAGKGIKGLSSMTDREVLERAFASKDGETFKALFNGEDLKNNHSNSDMALMRRLAFWCNGDIDQMLRIFAASGLYRPDKSPEYYEYSALKVLKDQSSYYHPKQNESKPQQEKKKSEGNSK